METQRKLTPAADTTPCPISQAHQANKAAAHNLSSRETITTLPGPITLVIALISTIFWFRYAFSKPRNPTTTANDHLAGPDSSLCGESTAVAASVHAPARKRTDEPDPQGLPDFNGHHNDDNPWTSDNFDEGTNIV